MKGKMIRYFKQQQKKYYYQGKHLMQLGTYKCIYACIYVRPADPHVDYMNTTSSHQKLLLYCLQQANVYEMELLVPLSLNSVVVVLDLLPTKTRQPNLPCFKSLSGCVRRWREGFIPFQEHMCESERNGFVWNLNFPHR